MSTDRPREKRARELTEQNYKIAKDRLKEKNETKAIARLYFFVGNNRETGLVSGEKIIVESITLVNQFDCLSKRDIHVWP